MKPHFRRIPCELHTDSEGALVWYIPVTAGRLREVIYIHQDFESTAEIEISDAVTGEAYLHKTGVSESFMWHPLVEVHSVTGSPLEAAEGGGLILVQTRLKVQVSGAGAHRTGSFIFVLD